MPMPVSVTETGQAWKYSGQLNERDLAFLQHQFITIPMGIEYYGFSERPLVRMATVSFYISE